MPVISRPQKTAINATMRIFSQPSNIDNAKVDSNNIRQRQMKRLNGVFGGL